MKTCLLTKLLMWSFFALCTVSEFQAQKLQVSENQRYFIDEHGKPFFWLGDTAWELFHRLDREEANYYLEDRASKGFTVIQAVALAELNGLIVPNPYEEIPLVNQDPTRPNEAYFNHVDYIIDKANALGIYVGLLPTWGDKFNKKWGVGPEIFTAHNARKYGAFLGKRYKDKNIIWILGGDRNPENEDDFAIIRAMAEGLEQGHKGSQLMTYHPTGARSSAEFFPDEPWLDFHFFQSGHGARNYENYEFNIYNRAVKPLKPTLDGEPRYEDHPVNWEPDLKGWFDAFDVRQAAYWSMLSGAAGHTYGNHNIWQMWEEGKVPVSWARTHWKEALNHDGSAQMGLMKELFELLPWYKLQPDQSLILNKNLAGAEYQAAGVSDDRTFALIYTPYGKTISVDLSRISGKEIKAWWYNPRDGGVIKIGSYKIKEAAEFTPHASGRGSDWILVLEDKQGNLKN